MNTEPPGDGSDLGEVIRFDVVDHGPAVRVLHVVGELDTLTAPLLAALVEAKDAADRDGSRLLVVPGSRIVKRALEATGLLSLFTVADDVPEALGAR